MRSTSSKPNSDARRSRKSSHFCQPHHISICNCATAQASRATFALWIRNQLFSINTRILSNWSTDNEKPCRPKRSLTTRPQQNPATCKSPAASPQKSSNVSKTRALYLSLHFLLNSQLTHSTLASPRNLHQPLPPRLPHELHLPPLIALLPLPHNNNDHQPLLEKDPQSSPKP